MSTTNDLTDTWTTGAYTSPSGTHYTKYVEVFKADNTGSLTWAYENGTQYGSWDLIWCETDENTYFTRFAESAVLVTMQADGTAKDTYGLTYTRS